MTAFALVDCNNFYASCERAFNPALENKPIIILSNNDGCVIARSNEAKALGIQMGEPYFKCQATCQTEGIHVFSSNYELYGDMSARVMALLSQFCPDMEVYSIDEAFLSFTSFNHYHLPTLATNMRQTIKQCTGIPVSIGIGPTKTLAKIANIVAKNHTKEGVFDLSDPELCRHILQQFPVAKIWGVGRRIAARLTAFNIHTAADLKKADLKLMRREFSVVMEKMISELNGISCLPLEESPPPKKQIVSSRSFGRPVVKITELEEAISSYTARACIKLRKQQSIASGIQVFLETNFFRDDKKQYANSINYYFTNPTSDTRLITNIAKICMNKLYRKNFEYKKAGIMLLDVIPAATKQYDLITKSDTSTSDVVMDTMDKINERFGKKSVFLCAEGTVQPWRMQRNYISKRYTTRLDELLVVKCI